MNAIRCMNNCIYSKYVYILTMYVDLSTLTDIVPQTRSIETDNISLELHSPSDSSRAFDRWPRTRTVHSLSLYGLSAHLLLLDVAGWTIAIANKKASIHKYTELIRHNFPRAIAEAICTKYERRKREMREGWILCYHSTRYSSRSMTLENNPTHAF